MISPTWYGLMYVLAFGLAWYLCPRLQSCRNLKISGDDWLYMLAAGVAGVLLGGRLGYVFFYEPSYFISNPGEIFAFWQGGMSAHGGFLGVGMALIIVSRQLKIDILALMDVIVVPVALGLALGRFGNYLNQEIFIGAGAWYAIFKNLFIAGAAYIALIKTKTAGLAAAVFLILYGILRFLTEYARGPQWEGMYGLTYGQLLTVPIFIFGLWLLKISLKTDAGLK